MCMADGFIKIAFNDVVVLVPFKYCKICLGLHFISHWQNWSFVSVEFILFFLKSNGSILYKYFFYNSGATLKHICGKLRDAERALAI